MNVKGFLLQKRLTGEWWETIQKFTKILIRVRLALVYEDQSLWKCFDIQMLCSSRHLKKNTGALDPSWYNYLFFCCLCLLCPPFCYFKDCMSMNCFTYICSTSSSLSAINTAEGQIKVIVIIKPLFHATFTLFVVSRMRDDALYFFIDSNTSTL